ncbi:HPr family phosphocarrier protein [Halobacillus shinanisalinarum]|uniref:HPr family phosphocarrier protein n=1 Tax=Halobacillus shinanisalinarum TaxID=2932258 RepID=A0ABY4H2Z1_9BACI|nr:HPr family phosphocarrier protein [Halobacillus shinanisalinarum]UOQ93337.1 HPr family phosphocarrier protein [Halobacillus shinanisalinarum]
MDEKKMNAGLNVAKGLETGSKESRKVLNIVHTANKFDSSIVLHTPHKVIDVKSFLGLSVSLSDKDYYKLEVHGSDKEKAEKAMVSVFKENGLKVHII